MSFTEIEKANIDWCAYRVPYNFGNKLIKVNPPLSEEDFNKEVDSPYRIKRYHYNYRHPEELSE